MLNKCIVNLWKLLNLQPSREKFRASGAAVLDRQGGWVRFFFSLQCLPEAEGS